MSVFRFLRDKKGVIYVETFYALLVVTVIGLAVYFIWQWRFSSEERSVEQAARFYLQAMATGDLAAARGVSEGRSAEAAGKLEGKNLAARVDEISTSLQALGRDWARVKATVELTLKDGTADVGWYELDVMKEAGGWKVISFREDEPDLSGWSLLWGRIGDVEAAREVFAGYLDALAAGKWDEAVKYLAGPVRKSMEASREVLGHGKIIGKVDDLQARLIWAEGKEVMVEFSYKVDGRDVDLAAVFYQTKDGWKIIEI
ncbi:heme/copper-type cytochrome/quinol oxidases, subunit 2 [Moorella thermoacetica Y72]|uniref:Heme/copper-type cytochrome/quinol oxidases, subunit 2 n=1 Tax=Moorella thermoacetica Y72 TaxID=1325331 RepID=A0A0S6U932_NEOTH|nr:hypothetical protein [Moorella thermoacetica]GAF24685.1 heme/copper-type cytochrome/quinol oxidases, subunit 2 [Moorella thermoacetica Y72]